MPAIRCPLKKNACEVAVAQTDGIDQPVWYAVCGGISAGWLPLYIVPVMLAGWRIYTSTIESRPLLLYEATLGGNVRGLKPL